MKQYKKLKTMIRKMKAESKPQKGRSKGKAFYKHIYEDYFEKEYFDEDDVNKYEFIKKSVGRQYVKRGRFRSNYICSRICISSWNLNLKTKGTKSDFE